MAGKDLDEKLSELIQSCKDEGILGDYFDQVKEMQDENEPEFVTEMITLFIGQADGDIAELTKLLSEAEVNFRQVRYLADKVYSSNTSFGGGSLVQNASRDLTAAGDAENKEECLEHLKVLSRDYQTVKEKLNKIAQIEKEIYDKKSKTNKKV